MIEWLYWLNNWCLILSTIYFLISFIVTHKIYKFVNKQQLKLSNLTSPYHPKSKMMNETTSFAMKSPIDITKRYKSIAQIDEESVIKSESHNYTPDIHIDDDFECNVLTDTHSKAQHAKNISMSLGMSVDSDGIDKMSDCPIKHLEINQDI